MTIVRRPLRDQAYDHLLAQVLDGRLVPGMRVRDTAIAAELGVSRTPVREALIQLTRERVFDADQGYGFEVRGLSPQEVEQMYPILWTLEALALRLSPLPTNADLFKLQELNAAFAAPAESPAALLDLDRRWHDALLAHCGNERLLEMIRSLKDGLRRYEYAYMQEAGHVAQSARQHTKVLAALRRRDLEAAINALEENWKYGKQQLLEWLTARDT